MSGLVSFAAALIAGGRSTRMGQDKAWLDWHGQPLWQHQLARLAELAPASLLISCREEQSVTPRECVSLHDPPGNEGPLPALARCLEHAQMPLFALAVDMPQIPVSFMHQLIGEGTHAGTGAVFHGSYGFEPLCAFYPMEVLPMLQGALVRGNLRLQAFVQEAVDARLLHVISLSVEQEAYFLNLNTPADLA